MFVIKVPQKVNEQTDRTFLTEVSRFKLLLMDTCLVGVPTG